jgi:hypothetical protein
MHADIWICAGKQNSRSLCCVHYFRQILIRASVCVRCISHDKTCVQRQEEPMTCPTQTMNAGAAKHIKKVDLQDAYMPA